MTAAGASSDEGRMALDVAVRLFGELGEGRTPDGAWDADRWGAIEGAGLLLAFAPEAAGGFGLPPSEALAIAKAAARVALPLPVADTLVGNWLLAQVGMGLDGGPVTFCEGSLELRRNEMAWHLGGKLQRAAWGRQTTVVAMASSDTGNRLVRVRPGLPDKVQVGSNIAGEPRDTLCISARLSDEDVGSASITAEFVRLAGAALRTVQIAGALEAVLDMTLGFVRERTQFGRPLGGFQVIQHQVAVLAEEAAAGQTAGDLAVAAFADGLVERADAVATAKIRAGEAAAKATAIAHQLHGAMGFTQEYPLHRLVRRLWAWRDEFGGEAEWALMLGRRMAVAGSDGLWPELTAI